MVNFSSGLVGLSMLTGDTSLFGAASAGFETNRVRKAKAQFTTPLVVAPWQDKSAAAATPQVSAIKRMKTIIDAPNAREKQLPADVQTSFLAYKALDRLRVLAEAGAAKTTGTGERSILQTAFAKGLEDLQAFLAEAPTDKVKLSFASTTRRAESVKAATATVLKIAGQGLLADRLAPIAGLTGTETLEVKLTRNGVTDTVAVDLATIPQPPKLDAVAQALNAAIGAIPMRGTDGNIVYNTDGTQQKKYSAQFLVEKNGGKWGLTLNAPGTERVALDQVGAKDALIVATGRTALDAASQTQILRFDDPAGSTTQKALGTIAGIDADATEAGQITGSKDGTVWASTVAKAVATDAHGNSYVVGTTAGDLGSNVLAGTEDLFLTKLNSEGKVLWQRTLGASAKSEGAAVAVGANGEIVVAGTVAGPFNGSLSTDSDMIAVKFDSDGNETFAASVRRVGNEEANAVALGADGSIFIGGKGGAGVGDAFIARLSSTGVLQERRTIATSGADTVTGLAIDGSGELLALTKESGVATLRRLDAQALGTDLGSLSLGAVDARAIAVSATGEIAVGGSTLAAASGTQVNALSGGEDGFVARIDAALSGASVSYLGTAGSDEVDSVAFMGSAVYAGGRTTGAMSGTRSGPVDGFVARIGAASGAIEKVSQFGQPALRTEPVMVAAAKGGAGVTGALGFHRGTLNPNHATSLMANTSLRAGDEFTIRVDDGAEKKIVVTAKDTLTTLADRIRKLAGKNATVTTPRSGDGNVLRIDVKTGHSISLGAGAEGKDALDKLGMEPGRLWAAPIPDDDAPKVRPGGNFALMLSDALSIETAEGAGTALGKIKSALSMTQTAFRSLYWDDMKAATVNGFGAGGKGASPYQQRQLAMYQDALTRLNTGGGYTGF
ncbi:MAG TPA: hypothetical protein VGB62_03555 [Allosphingosinicella sp.]|jgi:hypothetical protein